MSVLTERLPWFVAGPLIGLIITAVLYLVNQPLGVVGGYVALSDASRSESKEVGWRGFFVGGIALGGFLFALLSGRFQPSFSPPPVTSSWVGSIAALALGGVLMGYGARQAGGCTAGHGMCGTALGNPKSFAATATFMAVAIAVTQLSGLVLR